MSFCCTIKTKQTQFLSRSIQTDMIITDFAKAFDAVPHQRLLYKLNWYGIRATTSQWIQSFLSNHSQRVILENSQSSLIHVTSGVPQGTVLGPLLFLVYINDLPDSISHSTLRLFADDCLLYETIQSYQDTIDLQQYLLWLFIGHPNGWRPCPKCQYLPNTWHGTCQVPV